MRWKGFKDGASTWRATFYTAGASQLITCPTNLRFQENEDLISPFGGGGPKKNFLFKKKFFLDEPAASKEEKKSLITQKSIPVASWALTVGRT